MRLDITHTDNELALIEWDNEGYAGYQQVQPRTVTEAIHIPEWVLSPQLPLSDTDRMLIARSEIVTEESLTVLAQRVDTDSIILLHLLINARTPQQALQEIAHRVTGPTARRLLVKHENCGLSVLAVVAEEELLSRRDDSVLAAVAAHHLFRELVTLLVEKGEVQLPEGWVRTEEESLGLRSHVSDAVADFLEAYGEAA